MPALPPSSVLVAGSIGRSVNLAVKYVFASYEQKTSSCATLCSSRRCQKIEHGNAKWYIYRRVQTIEHTVCASTTSIDESRFQGALGEGRSTCRRAHCTTHRSLPTRHGHAEQETRSLTRFQWRAHHPPYPMFVQLLICVACHRCRKSRASEEGGQARAMRTS